MDSVTSEFLDALRERAEKNFKGHLHKSFIDWYVEAEFGQAKWDFTDGPNDGGIDAIVWRPGEIPPVLLLQSKFAERAGCHLLARHAYRDFREVVDAFHERA